MTITADFAAVAHLIADPARAAMLATLLDGRARPAGELARAAGITAQTASSHLAKLLDGGLLAVEVQGRHRYHRLAGPHVAEALERLAVIRPVVPPARPRAPNPEVEALRFCRSCYDHLAGRVGVGVTDALRKEGFLDDAPDRRFHVTPAGERWFASVGLEVGALRPTRRGLARPCLDWTERRHHLAGPLGDGLLEAFCRLGWLRRHAGSRRITVTPLGWAGLAEAFGIRPDDPLPPP